MEEIRPPSKEGDQPVDASCKEHIVFEKSKKAHIAHDGGYERGLALPLNLAGLGYDFSAYVIPGRGSEHQQDEPRHQPTVKNITAKSDEGVFRVKPLPLKGKRVIDKEKNREKIK